MTTEVTPSSVARLGEDVYAWRKPDSPHWDIFARAAEKTLESWDIMEHALDEDWGGGSEEAFEMILDNLLENFAEKWIQDKSTTLDAVCSFLDETMMDHFYAELDRGLSFPVARVLTTLFEECRRGKEDGARYVLREELAAAAEAESAPRPPLCGCGASHPAGETPHAIATVADSEPGPGVPLSGTSMIVETRGGMEEEEEEEGWTTVKSSRRRNRG